MLVLAREWQQQIVIGDDSTTHPQLSATERKALTRLAGQCTDKIARDALSRIVAAQPGPIVVSVEQFRRLDSYKPQVRLGIEAPKTITVHRREVFDALQRESRAVARAESGSARADDPVCAGALERKRA